MFKFIFTLLLLVVARPLGLGLSATAQTLQPVINETGIFAHPFDMSQVKLSNGRWHDNQQRTLAYLTFVDLDRLLYNFRTNHKLSTNGATPNTGWDKPGFNFRGHFQGHVLTAWAQCYAQLRDPICRQRALTYTVEMQKCQANNAAAGFNKGFLGAISESEYDALETATKATSHVPYYIIHKLLAGFRDSWRYVGDPNAKQAMLDLADWVDTRTSKLSYATMQNVLMTEFGGMVEVLTDIYALTGDSRWLKAAQRFEHNDALRPLAANQDKFNGLHANTQHPKWIGASREYKYTGNTTYLNVARNAWNIVLTAHTYAIGGNSVGEWFRAPNAISAYLTDNAAESCNSYNMLKLTRELWTTDTGNTTYFDYYERTLINQLVGQQNPADSHGHVTYFNSLNPGARRGVGPKNGGGTWSTDYSTFWCCQATALETNTKLADSVYYYNDASLFVNLFVPSQLNWSQRGVNVTQTTTYPVSDTTTLQITGSNSGTWALRVRIPAWSSGASFSINGNREQVSANPGTYAVISREWASGDTVTITLPKRFWLLPANDKPSLAVVAYGPVILVGNYGSTNVSEAPTLTLSSIKRTSDTTLTFTATANGKSVTLGSWYDAQGYNYVSYWVTSGSLPTTR